MSRREKEPSRDDAERRTTRQMTRRGSKSVALERTSSPVLVLARGILTGDGADADDDQDRGPRDGESSQPAVEGATPQPTRGMNFDAPVRMSTRLAQARAAASVTRLIDARVGPERSDQPSLGTTQPMHYQRRYQGEVDSYPAQNDQDWQDVDPESPAFTRALQGNTPRNAEDKEQERTDTSLDPSTDNGDSSANTSLEAQQWSDSEGNNRQSSAGEIGRESQGDVPCRVSWCEHAGKRYGLCWAHGGVKKCCHRNCPKIALITSEFCSIHEREVSTSTF
ncbi:hypothetical protein PR003_g22931 [Phytophthora rubi]|uniref:Uncharacterized protein n=1 Tax=Phytophthora rubi TaxID=129364 RepID=A0A6A4D403_9STRA|nr:hypothetical protein PR002_g22095 [Phytophthora rubi]KAE9299688.1 hypothetical protein PR003_g22931 [Phytophthora rubi]